MKKLAGLPGHRVKVSSERPAYESFVGVSASGDLSCPQVEEWGLHFALEVIGRVVGSLLTYSSSIVFS